MIEVSIKHIGPARTYSYTAVSKYGSIHDYMSEMSSLCDELGLRVNLVVHLDPNPDATQTLEPCHDPRLFPALLRDKAPTLDAIDLTRRAIRGLQRTAPLEYKLAGDNREQLSRVVEGIHDTLERQIGDLFAELNQGLTW